MRRPATAPAALAGSRPSFARLTQFARVFKDKDCAARSKGFAQAIARHQQHGLLTVLIRINLFWQLLFHGVNLHLSVVKRLKSFP